MKKTNRFRVKKINNSIITVEEGRKNRSSLALFFIKNGKLIFWIALLFSITVFVISMYYIISNIKESSIVKYESNGVIVEFSGTDDSILNGTPITESYASKIFNSVINFDYSNVGVVIKLKEIKLEDRIIIYYSDNTTLVKYNNGEYLKVYSVNEKYGINENGIVNAKAQVKELKGRIEKNNELGISIIHLSDGSMEITKENTTFYIRNSDITNNNEQFYTNLSGVSIIVDKDKNKTYYSDGTIKEDDYIIIDNNRYNIVEEKTIYNDIKIIYYENGYAEIIKNDLNIMVMNGEHILYDKNSFEIIDNTIHKIDIKDKMDIKEINLNNTTLDKAHYVVVLEELDNYKKYNISKVLLNDFIRFNIYVNGNKFENNFLNNNLKDNSAYEGLSLTNNTYLLYEGDIDTLSTASIKIGLWVDYENITNEYMDSAFIGTVKVYIESVN